MPKILRNTVVVGLSTVGSRMLGLARDIMIFAGLGTGAWNDAFILAFTLPNLFRRLLGEGALASAFAPIFSDLLQRSSLAEAFVFLNQVLIRLLLVLSIITLSGTLLLGLLIHYNLLSERWLFGAELSMVLLPYMILMCLAAIISVGLNIVGRFVVAASVSMLLNISMIIALLIAMWLNCEPSQTVYWLCGGVLFGGFLQLIAPALDLMCQGWRPELIIKKASRETEIRELWLLFLPGLAGAAIVHINALVSRFLAYSLDESAVSMLYLASRLIELPMGVFTVSLATVFFPLMVRSVSNRDNKAFADAAVQGMRLVVCITLPAGIGLAVLGEPILTLLFRWGAFSAQDVEQTFPLLVIYGLGLPFYSATTIAIRGLHACKDMKSPVRVAGFCLLLNLAVGLMLMQFYGAAGLAIGNVLAAIIQSLFLWQILSRNRNEFAEKPLRQAFFKILCSGLVMGLFCICGHVAVLSFNLAEKLYATLMVCVFIPFGAALYFGMLYLLKFEELNLLTGLFRRFLSKSMGSGKV